MKSDVIPEVDRIAESLIDVSHRIHARPELNYQEHFAHELLTEILESSGFSVTRHAYGLETAFEATFGSSGAEVLILLEYDALPGIGHGCGHNIIAAAGLGAALSCSRFLSDIPGRLRVLGTPAEEGGGGKIVMARNGAFDTGDAALMVHPADADLVSMTAIAVQTLDVTYEGIAAHAAAAPWAGRNALDAAVLGYMNIAALRQHIRPTERIHGVFTEAGEKANIVPRRAAANWYVRSDTLASLAPLKQRVSACLEGAAHACGCTMTSTWDDHPYADVRDNASLVETYAANMRSLGRDPLDPSGAGHHVVGSTDLGNVSYLLPAMHPMVGIAPRGVAIHTEEFAHYAASESGDLGVLDGAKALAMTAVDVWSSSDLRTRIRTEWDLIEAPDGLLG
ncbi:MAG: M20 family metallopeptidase [Actinomycetota bacterium]